MVRTASLLSTLRTTGTAKSGRRPSVPAQERKALPLPVRLLVMLLAFVAMVAFAVALARLTLEPSPASKALIHTNLHPGSSLRAYLDQPALRDAVKQIGGNIVLGVPFGVLVPVLIPKARGILRVLLLTAVVMLLVELVQGTLITGRAFDIDDVILNTSGALVGYLLLGRRMGRAVHPKRRRKGLRNRRGAPKA
ncbi:VanZ family protein [Actinobacteria bacterium OK006]|nr:VanZ family protein [Actinobacteria bacterium OK006]